jgi:D-xylose transport system substrate-binding protein
MKNTYALRIFYFLLFVILPFLHADAQKIGLLMDSYITDRWYMDQKLFTDKVKALGGEVQVEVAYGDAAEQVRLTRKMIDDGVKVLVVVPVDAHKCSEIVDIAKKANVPVISYDRLIVNPATTLYISYNNVKVGELQANYALNKMPRGNYLLINGPETDNNAILFRQGQLNVLKPHADKGEIKIIADFVMSDWGEIGAIMKIDEFLSASKIKPDAIVAANDALANGSIQSLPANLLGKIIITGQDADIVGLKNIIAGRQSMTIYKPIRPLAELSAETAMKLARGEAVHGMTKLQNEGISVDAILLDPVAVDKLNYNETVIKDGHASLSEVIDK